MGGVTFRHARPADAPRILAIKQAAIDGIKHSSYDAEQLSAWRPDDSAISDFRHATEIDQFEILLAEHDGDIVGYGVLNAGKNRIDAVFVHPDHAGNGIASSLVKQFESRARIYEVAELKIVSSLNAKSFYESLGYWDFGRKTQQIDGVELEFAIMRKLFGGGN